MPLARCTLHRGRSASSVVESSLPSDMTSDRDFTRRLIVTVVVVAVAVIVLAALWEAREALMLIYVSGLIAMGFSPLVRIIERPHAKGRRRVPRVLAILAIY